MRTHQYRHFIEEICHHRHLSADEIFEELKKTQPQVGRATIYRNIEQMSAEGILRKIPWIGGKSHYEYHPEAHAHIVDDATREVMDFDMENVKILNLPDGYELSEVCIYLRKKSPAV